MSKVLSAEGRGGPSRRIRTAIVGGGQGCAYILKVVQEDVNSRFPMEIIGVADPNPEAPGATYARESGVRVVTTDYRDFYSMPDLELLLELTGSSQVRDELERTRPRSVHLIDHFGAQLFWDLHTAERAIVRQRSEMQARVERERERFSQILDCIPDEVVVVDTDMVIQYANATFLRANGLSMDKVLGCYCYDIEQKVRGECQVAVENCPFFNAVKGKRSVSMVRKHFDSRGNARYAAIVAAPVLDRHAEVTGMIEMTRDITHRIMLEEELRATEVQLKQFMERAPIATSVKNRSLQYVEVNPAMLELLGLSEQEVIGKTDLEILPRKAAEELRAADREVIKRKTEVSYDANLTFHSKRVSVSTLAYPVLGPDDTVKAVCALARDITKEKATRKELRQTQEYLQNILDNAPVMIITSDLRSRIVRFNRGAVETLGYTAEEVIGKPVARTLYRDPSARDALMRIVEKHGIVQEYETELRRKDGSEVPVSITLSELRDSKGRRIGYIGISRDISHRQALMGQIIQTERMAAVGRLAAGVAHEINNPLAVIGETAGFLSDILNGVVDDSDLDKELRQSLPLIAAQIKRCRSITRRLLSFARKTEDTVEFADIGVALDEILPFLEKEARLACVRVHRDYRTDLPRVAIEEVQLEEVFINLIKNAIQALAPLGGGNIWINADLVDNRVVATVRDDGPGIGRDAQARLFDPFFTTKPPNQGTGLGLSICYGIVKRCDGEIRVDSEPGQGATFRVILKTAT